MLKNLYHLAIAFVLLAVVLLLWGLWSGVGDDINTNTWETYTNNEFNFSIAHPADWEVAEFPEHPAAPLFNIYKPTGENPPFTHHSEVVQVSVYPHGFPTEGVLAQHASSTVSFSEETNKAHDFLLKNGDVWGTFATFSNPPASWKPFGFVWARATIMNKEVLCFRDGEEITNMNMCDPLFGDTIIHEGSVNKKERAIEKEVLESFTFIQPKSTNVTDSLIQITAPQEGVVISSPLTVHGEARGQWYFEATFPLVLTDWDGRIIAEGYATAQDNWMSEEFVPFEGTLTFKKPEDIGDFSDWGHLILQKANPSGLPEHDDAFEIRVRFRQ